MGKRGPPPKPSSQKKLEGTYRPDRAARNEVVAPPGAPAVPDRLPAAARVKWDELVPILLERRTLSIEDGAILEEHCRAYAMWRRYQADAEKRLMVKTPFGPKVNPAAGEARKWEAIVRQTGDRLGVNASARSRVGAQPAPEKPAAEKELEKKMFGVIDGGRQA
jgi:P27 family predicted phage terminase small subunit